MVKFVKVAFKKDMINVVDNNNPIWYDCDPKAKGFAKTSFKEGDDVELVIEQRNNKPFVTQVRRPGQATGGQSAPVAQQTTSQPTSEQSTPPQAPVVAAKPAYGQKSPEESEKITRLSIMSSAANAAQIMTGQITDPNVLGDVVIGLYTRILAEIKK